MTKLDKAKHLYLRGFGSQYIKRRTGISMQSMLKQLKAQGITLSKQDIVNYQVEYITQRYSTIDVEIAYCALILNNDNPYELRRGRHLHYLGCGFGNYVAVFKRLLGECRYNELKAKVWKIKQTKTVQSRYGVSNVFDKRVFADFVSQDAIERGREKRTATLMERYGVEHPTQDPAIARKMVESARATFQERYGVDAPMQVESIKAKAKQSRQETMLKRYGGANSVEIPEIREKIFTSRKRNGTLSTSRSEEMLYTLLCDCFPTVRRNVIVDDRYPWHVDFYIPSRDLFIELNGDGAHGGHWFDETDERDQQRLASWRANAELKYSQTGKSSRYHRYIDTWTVRDVAKRQQAQKAQLNYLVFWDSRMIQRRGQQIPRLLDARAWIADGCPDSSQWHSANTY